LRVNTESSYSAIRGCTFLFCEEPQVKAEGSLYFYSYIYYLSKYYELLDTILQLLKGRAPPHFFLHVYHHAAALLMAWARVEYRMSLQFMRLLFNTGGHVLLLFLPCPWMESLVEEIRNSISDCSIFYIVSVLCGNPCPYLFRSRVRWFSNADR